MKLAFVKNAKQINLFYNLLSKIIPIIFTAILSVFLFFIYYWELLKLVKPISWSKKSVIFMLLKFFHNCNRLKLSKNIKYQLFNLII